MGHTLREIAETAVLELSLGLEDGLSLGPGGSEVWMQRVGATRIPREEGSGGCPQVGTLGWGGWAATPSSGSDLTVPLPVASVTYGAVFLWAVSLPHTLGAGHRRWHCAGEIGEPSLVFRMVEGIDSSSLRDAATRRAEAAAWLQGGVGMEESYPLAV